MAETKINGNGAHGGGIVGAQTGGHRFLFFADLLKRPVCAGTIQHRIGRLTDLVFAVADPYPEAVGIFIDHGWGKPTELVPWDRVIKIDNDAIFVQRAAEGDKYPPFVDQPGWILVDKHLMGRTILDIDGRRIEVVNDVRLLGIRRQPSADAGLGTPPHRLFLVDVDVSFNGFLRRWGLRNVRWVKDHYVSWKWVQPLSLEDAIPTDRVQLSITRQQLLELPGEDLADALEQLTGTEQQALFSALDSEKAAETLVEAEPRAQRQLVADLPREKAAMIFAEMTAAQIANVFASLPHDETEQLFEILPPDRARLVRTILSEEEAAARDLMSQDYVSRAPDATIGTVLREIKGSNLEHDSISYVYIVNPEDQVLQGVLDVRDLVLSPDEAVVGDVMVSPAVAAEENEPRGKLVELFEKYGFRMIPIVDTRDRMLGVVNYNDIMKAPELRT